MTKQEIFDTVAKHLLAQGRRSVEDDLPFAGCLYRGPEGTKCAAGVLIKDEYYSPSLEGNATTDFHVLVALEASIGTLDAGSRALIQNLQCVHDSMDPPHWRKVLNNIAGQFGLQPLAA